MSVAFGAFLIASAVVPAVAGTAFGAPFPADQIEFFENKVRPVFAEHCYTCHSDKAEKVKGGLRLDTPELLLKGGSSGPAIVAGDPEASLLIKAVRYKDPDLQMPPKNKKLSDAQIANLEAWVKMGAPLPSSGPVKKAATIDEVRARHWAFQPVKQTPLPAVRNSRWVQTPVDRFVLAKLEKRNLSPAPAADRRTLIRRVTYDLIGLPPTADEVEDFIHDNRPGAFERVVDRLLASPHYGERWARYWLDVARYADTRGYLAGGEERRYAFSYTYRDYVVRSYNEDKPYNQFLIEQIAADKLPLGEDRRALAALGFLTLGRRFLNNQNDIIDDRIDVVTRGTLGLTVACARCHDHKFDPILSKDYYALHGVFASSEEPGEPPLLGPLKESKDYQDYLKEKARIEQEIEEFKIKEIEKFVAGLRQRVGDYMLGAHDAALATNINDFDLWAGERKLNGPILRRWMRDLETRSKSPDFVYGPWFALARVPEAEFPTKARELITGFKSDPKLASPVLAQALEEGVTNSLKDAANVYNKVLKDIETEWRAALDAAAKESKPPPTSLPNPEREALRQMLYAEGAAVNVPRAEVETIHARRLREGSAPFRNRIEALSWTHSGAPPRAMAMADRASPANSHVLIRGNPGNPGEEVPRRFVEVLCAKTPVPFTNGSGRLELARSIASPENPLTARVYVNRIWLHHFREGIVTTPGDFGVRTEEPAHRALLDYLAASFIEHGWSTKSLHRQIVLSATYQQSSEASATTLAADPENRLFSRMNRQRLDFEAMRDTLLAVAQTIDVSVGGIPVDLQSQPFSTRRTLYGLIDRQNLPAMFRTFDFANPDTSSQVRFRTTVPQQALFLMNSPFVLEQAKHVSERAEIGNGKSTEEKIRALYQIVLQRPPAREELELGEKFLCSEDNGKSGSDDGASKTSRLQRYTQVLLLSNEVMFVD